jgi:signal transduction histidine kinase
MNNPEVYEIIFDNDIYVEDSGVKTIQACVFPIFIDPDNCIFGSVIRDVTELKQIENQLRTLNETQSKMFSIIAHDLRSPFNSIIGFSELPLGIIESYTPEKLKQIFEHINLSAKPTLSLIDNLLDWAKSQTGQMTCQPERFMLKPVLNDVVKVHHLLAEIKNISLNYFILTDIEIYADLNQFKSILRNLISNAIKFTEKNGMVDIFADQHSDHIEITVSDNGVGMTKEIKNKIFNSSTYYFTNGTEGEKGSGLGLNICKEFVEKNGGKIWVESEVNKGSKFKFTIPVKL